MVDVTPLLIAVMAFGCVSIIIFIVGRHLTSQATMHRRLPIPVSTSQSSKSDVPNFFLGSWAGKLDEKTFGKGFDCFAEDAKCNLGVADWHGREAIRENLRRFIDKGFTAHHDVVEFWDSTPCSRFFMARLA